MGAANNGWAQSASASAGGDNGHIAFDPSSATFSDHEFSLDLFGFTASQDRSNNPNRIAGPGAAGNYFITQNLGVGVETYTQRFVRPYLLNFMGEFRYPIPNLSLAPYAFAGVGRQWRDAPQWLGFIGGGLEFRFNTHTGVFVDAREVFAARNYNLMRAGIRIAF